MCKLLLSEKMFLLISTLCTWIGYGYINKLYYKAVVDIRIGVSYRQHTGSTPLVSIHY